MKSMFTTHGGDSALNNRSGQRVEVIRPLTDSECDIFDTGPMFRIRFDDGLETDAFEDELPDLMHKRIADIVYEITKTVCEIILKSGNESKYSEENSRALFREIYDMAYEFELEHFNSEDYMAEVKEFATKKAREYFGLTD